MSHKKRMRQAPVELPELERWHRVHDAALARGLDQELAVLAADSAVVPATKTASDKKGSTRPKHCDGCGSATLGALSYHHQGGQRTSVCHSCHDRRNKQLQTVNCFILPTEVLEVGKEASAATLAQDSARGRLSALAERAAA